MTHYDITGLDTIEIERRIRQLMSELLQDTGNPIAVWRAARSVMESMRRRAKRKPSHDTTGLIEPDRVLRAVAAAHHTTVNELRTRTRVAGVSFARHHAIWELHLRRPDLALVNVAAWLNRRDHATVLNSVRRFSLAVSKGHYEEERALVELALS